jgi:hypothetical protein
MSYREEIYKNALKQIEKIYIESKYNPNADLYRSLDIMNSVSDGQFASKEWLVKNLDPFINHAELRNVAVLGSWYGLVGMILRHHISKDVSIVNIDSEELTKEIGFIFTRDNPIYKNNYYKIDDAVNHIMEAQPNAYQIIINTSCEHMEPDDIQFILKSKGGKSMVCFQSNNYDFVQSHVNTHKSLDDFANSLNLIDVYYAGTLRTNNYERYMVIGV